MSSPGSSFLPIRLTGAEKGFEHQKVWSEISFEITQGHMLALAGPSESGKTTLLNCIGLLENIDAGLVDSWPVHENIAIALSRRGLSGTPIVMDEPSGYILMTPCRQLSRHPSQ